MTVIVYRLDRESWEALRKATSKLLPYKERVNGDYLSSVRNKVIIPPKKKDKIILPISASSIKRVSASQLSFYF